jgi:hypothetical protein
MRKCADAASTDWARGEDDALAGGGEGRQARARDDGEGKAQVPDRRVHAREKRAGVGVVAGELRAGRGDVRLGEPRRAQRRRGALDPGAARLEARAREAGQLGRAGRRAHRRLERELAGPIEIERLEGGQLDPLEHPLGGIERAAELVVGARRVRPAGCGPAARRQLVDEPGALAARVARREGREDSHFACGARQEKLERRKPGRNLASRWCS